MKKPNSRIVKSLLIIWILGSLGCNNLNTSTGEKTMPDSSELKTYPEPERKIIEDVKQFGFHIAFVPEDEYLPGFAYTIGLMNTYEHPEIILFGLNQQLLGGILNGIGEEIKSGKTYKPNIEYENILSNYPVKFLEVKKEHYQDYLGYAGWFYDNTFEFPAYQLIWTDKESKYPWDDGFNENWKFKQPILDRNTDFKFYEERSLGVFTTQEILDGKPILWVYHNDDGDWQFHSEGNPDLEHAKIVSLESLVHIDPSLNEIYYLNFGQSASRKTLESEWVIHTNK